MSEPTSDPGQPPVVPEPAPPAYPSYPQPTYPQPTYPDQTYQPQQYPAYAQPDYSQPDYSQPAYGYPAYQLPVSDRRPGTVTAAAVITWICTGLCLAGLFVVLGLLIGENQSFYDELVDEDISASDLKTFGTVIAAVLAFWAVGAIVTAVFAFRRQNWARVLLVISSVLSVPLLLLTAASVVTIFFALGAIATVVLLFTGGANEWYRGGRLPAPPQPPAAPGPTFY